MGDRAVRGRCRDGAGRGAGRADTEAGSASMLVVALAGVVLLLGLAATFMTAAGAAHRRAQAGADLAALAGAGALQRGDDPCAASGRISADNGADMVSCLVDGDDVSVVVRVAGPELWGHTFDIRGRSRAGPTG